jgi:methylthioribose-1-phosphate isomerase
MFQHIRYDAEGLHLLDQRVLPKTRRWIRCESAAEAAAAITDMVIRGAPAIGITAAYGLALEVRRQGDLDIAKDVLLAARPTAVNLRWAVERIGALATSEMEAGAIALHREDISINRSMGRHGAALLKDNATLYTHCNAGALATGGWGTALGVIRSAAADRGIANVYAGETRPYLQGARLTAFELAEDGIPVTLITDSTAATVLASGEVDAVIVGADRVAANGDAANKIGTLGLAIMAKHYGVSFYVAVPMSTIDLRCPTGDLIPIEERSASEVQGHAGVEWAADVPVYNPAFDVTPAALITAWITEHGLWEPTS